MKKILSIPGPLSVPSEWAGYRLSRRQQNSEWGKVAASLGKLIGKLRSQSVGGLASSHGQAKMKHLLQSPQVPGWGEEEEGLQKTDRNHKLAPCVPWPCNGLCCYRRG